jgi:hypothetical protein
LNLKLVYKIPGQNTMHTSAVHQACRYIHHHVHEHCILVYYRPTQCILSAYSICMQCSASMTRLVLTDCSSGSAVVDKNKSWSIGGYHLLSRHFHFLITYILLVATFHRAFHIKDNMIRKQHAS